MAPPGSRALPASPWGREGKLPPSNACNLGGFRLPVSSGTPLLGTPQGVTPPLWPWPRPPASPGAGLGALGVFDPCCCGSRTRSGQAMAGLVWSGRACLELPCKLWGGSRRGTYNTAQGGLGCSQLWGGAELATHNTAQGGLGCRQLCREQNRPHMTLPREGSDAASSGVEQNWPHITLCKYRLDASSSGVEQKSHKLLCPGTTWVWSALWWSPATT